MAIELVPLCAVRIQLKPPIEVGAGPVWNATDHRSGERSGQGLLGSLGLRRGR